MYENYNYSYETDFYEEYTKTKVKEARGVFSRLFLALFFFIVALNVTVLLAEIVLILSLGREEAVSFFNSNVYVGWLINSLPQYLIAFPVFFLIVRGMKVSRIEKGKIRAMEFFALYLVAQVFIFVGSLIGDTVNSFFSLFKGDEVFNPIDSMLSDSPIWLTFIFTVILAPVFEELIFRKLMIDRLSRFGNGIAITVSAVAFGLFHGNFYQFFYAMALGFILGYLYTRTRDVRFSVAMHALINFFGSVVTLLLSSNIVRFTESLESISNGIEVNMPQFIMDLMIVGSYSLIQYAMIGGGIAILIVSLKRKKIKLNSVYEYKIPKERVSSAVFLNVGAILFLVATLATFILNIIA